MQTSLNKVVNLLQEIATSNQFLNGNFTFCDVADLGASAPLSLPRVLSGAQAPVTFTRVAGWGGRGSRVKR